MSHPLPRQQPGRTLRSTAHGSGGDDVHQEHDELPIYSAQSISDALNAKATRSRGAHPAVQTNRPARPVRQPAGYVAWRPFAVLPWVGALLTLIWLPLVVVGAWWNLAALRRQQRGVAGAAALLLLAVINQIANDPLIMQIW